MIEMQIPCENEIQDAMSQMTIVASSIQVNAGMANNKEDENKCLANFEGGRNITDESKGHVDEVGTCFEGEEEGSEVEANSRMFQKI